MRRNNKIFSTAFIGCALLAAGTALAADVPAFDIPRLSDIAIDGSADDWGEQGFPVRVHASRDGTRPPTPDLSARASLGWSQEGLLVLVDVRDDTPYEHFMKTHLWKLDSIELFVSDGRGSTPILQSIIAPGRYERTPGIRTWHRLHRSRRTAVAPPAPPDVAASVEEDGYIIEASLPWSNLGSAPARGDNVGFRIFVNDADSPQVRKQRIQWLAGPEPHGRRGDPDAMQLLRLADKSGIGGTVAAYGEALPHHRLAIRVYGIEEDRGKPIVLKRAGQTLYSGAIKRFPLSDIYGDIVDMPVPVRGNGSGPIAVSVDDRVIARIPVPGTPLRARIDFNAPFARTIARFEARDLKSYPEPEGTVCIGSSSMRMWRTIEEDLEPLAVIHRGFGGAWIRHVLHYADRIVIPYEPDTVLVYAGENDIAGAASVDRVVQDTKDFFTKLHDALPDAHIYYMSMKPSPSRWRLWPEMTRANQRIDAITQKREYVDYIDIATPMRGEDGEPRPDIFLADKLHMNEKGYEIWTRVVRNALMPGNEEDPE